MFTPNSLRNLIDGGWQTVLSMTGISFAIILMFMQLGFLGAVLDTAVLFYNNMKFDLLVRSPDYYHIADAKEFSRDYLAIIDSVNNVEAVQPVHINLGRWNYAERSVQQGMLILGVSTAGQTFAPVESHVVVPNVTLLTDDRSMVVDAKSKSDFLGYDNSHRFSNQAIGLRVELNGQSVEIRGLFKMGTGLAANGAAVVNEDGFQRIFQGYGGRRVGLGLIQLNDAGLNQVLQTRQKIYDSIGGLPDSKLSPVEILTRDEANARERMHWVWNTPVGFIFLAGVGISFIVGAVIVYIVLSADIDKQMAEYATLKAMGYANSYLYRVVMEQALVLCVTSYLVSFLVCSGLYNYVGEAANLPMNMTLDRQVVVFGSSLLMCFLSAAIATRKLRKADPADLY